MKNLELFDRYSRLRKAVAEAYSGESCDERRFAELVMQLGVVEAQIAPLRALASATGDGPGRSVIGSPWGSKDQPRTTLRVASLLGHKPSRSTGSPPPPCAATAQLRGASSVLDTLTELGLRLCRRPEVGPGRPRRFHWFAWGTGVPTIDLPIVRLVP